MDVNAVQLWLGDEEVVQYIKVKDGEVLVEYGEGWQVHLMHEEYPEFKSTYDNIGAKVSSSRVPPKGRDKSS